MMTPLIIDADRIRAIVSGVDFAPKIAEAFSQYSQGKANVPPVGELLFANPSGEVHIKYGYIEGDAYYVVKIASGFVENRKRGLPSSDGLMLVFSRETGQLAAALLDGGYLTDVRTAAAGAVAAKYLAPRDVHRIGIVGTGTQARLQLRALRNVVPCRDVLLWGRSAQAREKCAADMEGDEYRVSLADDTRELAQACNLIVTTTAADKPLLFGNDLRPGTHVTAMGSDTPNKRELDSRVLARADVVVADSVAQCVERGEIAHALRGGSIKIDKVIELGAIIAGTASGRTSDEQITVADLTGVAVQDCAIAAAVYESASQRVV